MTAELVQEALAQAAQFAFELGVRHGQAARWAEAEGAAGAVRYAELVVLPVVEAAIEETVEATALLVGAGL